MYEVVWHKYLAILLGAQARATSIVLAIFLGGIALGYATFGRWSRYKKWNLIKAYAIVECGLAAWAFAFPYLFRGAIPLTSTLYSWLGVNSLFIDIFVSMLLIGFPTFLMGGTLPLLTQGLSEDFAEASKTHAKIYGVNTLGACFGCLLAGYVLIPNSGLLACVWLGAFFNLFVGLTSYFVYAKNFARTSPVEEMRKGKNKEALAGLTPVQMALFGVSFLSGFYLLTLQTVIIRLVGLSTGASNYNFTLVVSIFILGLGTGSLLVRRIANFNISHLFWNQVGVSVFLCLLYISGDYWSYLVHLIRISFRDNIEVFYPYQAMLGVFFASILIVPIGFAGFTLPLSFHLLKDRPETLGHRVGQLYGLNSLGCVLGALFGGYLLLDYFNLDQLFKFVVFLTLISCVLAGYVYLKEMRPDMRTRVLAGGILVPVLIMTWFLPLYSRDRMTQPFRHPSPIDGVSYKGPKAFGNYLARSTKYLLFKDGPNTSLGVGASMYEGKEMSRTIFVNGKSDGNTRGDFFTTIMLGHIPGLLARKLDNIAIIGFGTGITIGSLALYDEAKSIDVCEISGTILQNSSMFDDYNGGVSKNKKIHFNEMDAFRFLEGTQKKFDVIVSEPSNPWVAGIENLYSSDFYEMALKKLNSDGLFVQWIHTYSFNDDLFRMVLRTMGKHFPNVHVFQLKGGDYALVATQTPIDRADLRRGQKRMRSSPNTLVRALGDGGIDRFETMLALEVMPFSLTKAVAEGAEIHELESPKLSNESAKAFFVGNSVRVDELRKKYKAYYPSVSDSLLADYTSGKMPDAEMLAGFRRTFCDHNMSKNGGLCEETLAALKFVDNKYKPEEAYNNLTISPRELAAMTAFAGDSKGKFNADDLQELNRMFDAYKKFYSPINQIPFEGFRARIDRCLKTVPYSDVLHGECLLQKILIYETVRTQDAEFKSASAGYINWFSQLPTTSRNYTKLKEARDLLEKLIATQK